MELYSEMEHVFQLFHLFEDMSVFAMNNIKDFINSTNSTVMGSFEYNKKSSIIIESTLKDPYFYVKEGYEELESIKNTNPEVEKEFPGIIKRFATENEQLKIFCQSC